MAPNRKGKMPKRAKELKENSLERSRQNQRRSRANKKEYIDRLQKENDNYRRDGVQASIEMQQAARRTREECDEAIRQRDDALRERDALREYLQQRGINPLDIENASGSNPPHSAQALSSGTNRMMETTEQLQDLILRGASPHSPEGAGDILSTSRGQNPFARPSQPARNPGILIPRMIDSVSREETLTVPAVDHPSVATSARSSFSESTGVPTEDFNTLSQPPASAIYSVPPPTHHNVYGMTQSSYPIPPRWNQPSYHSIQQIQTGSIPQVSPTQLSPVQTGQMPSMPPLQIPPLPSAALSNQHRMPSINSPLQGVMPNIHTLSSMHSPTSPIHNVANPPQPLQHPAGTIANHAPVYQQIQTEAANNVAPNGLSPISPVTQTPHGQILYSTATQYPPPGPPDPNRRW